jgi:hypothetical protein
MDQTNAFCFGDEDVEDDFDGVMSDSRREAPTPVASFGLPLDLVEVDVTNRGSDEFEPMAPLTRGLADVAMGPTDSSFGDADSALFELTPGFGFTASAALFQHPATEPTAPLLPFYLRPSATSFQSTKPLARLCRELEAAWPVLGATASPVEMGDCAAAPLATAWACCVENSVGSCEFEVRVFDCGDARQHLVEVRSLDGCRFAFSGVAAALAQHLRVAYTGGSAAGAVPAAFRALPSEPPVFPVGHEIPALVSCRT